MTPRLPEPDERERPPTEEARNMATCLALVTLLGFGAGLIFLTAMIMPDAFLMLLFLGAFPLYFLLHYLVWGRLMSRLREKPDAEEGRD